MTIPFLNLFKRKPVQEQVTVVVAPPAPVEKPSSERLSKTVVPNATRPPETDPFRRTNAASSTNGHSTSPVSPRNTISMNGGGLPPALALALAPNVERAISLALADVIAAMPAGLVRPPENGDADLRVFLKAAELEKGMAKGQPTMTVGRIYEQMPEIFVQKVQASDTRQVPLPMAKVLEQFSKLQLRADQYREQNVPQVETPFLQVTLEDNAKFGVPMEPIQTGELPPVRLEFATAETIAAAEPEPAGREKYSISSPEPIAPIQPAIAPLQVAAKSPPPVSMPAPAQAAPPAAPTRIPFRLTPNGTGAPAPERVPASSGPSVPTSVPAPAAPTRIPFKISAPSEDLRPNSEPWLTRESFAVERSANGKGYTPPIPPPASNGAATHETKISLRLKPILQSLPPFQLTADISGVSDEALLEVPLSLVQPQLISGRVLLTPEQFAAALSDEHRALFSAKDIASSVALPLQEVLKSMPSALLRMREDQVEEAKENDFVTPFSAKAEEDAKRFHSTQPAPALSAESLAAPTRIAVPVAAVKEPLAVIAPAAQPAAPPAPPAAEVKKRSALQEALETDDELDAKAVVAHVEKIGGVKACAIMFSDGLSLAGNLPAEYEADGLCAMAPSLLQRVENHMDETKLGALHAMTLSCTRAAVTFFLQGNLCLAALHKEEELASGVRERLTRIVQELSRKYSHPV